LVHEQQMPSLVVSHLHRPIVKLQQQTVMPLRLTVQLHRPPASIVQRFWTMLHAVGSSQEQLIFMPPVHFSNLKVQRGTIIQFETAGTPLGPPIGLVPGAPMPGIAMPVRSIITFDMLSTP